MLTDHGAQRVRQRLEVSDRNEMVRTLCALWDQGRKAVDSDYVESYHRPGTEGRVVVYKGARWVIVRNKYTQNVITVFRTG